MKKLTHSATQAIAALLMVCMPLLSVQAAQQSETDSYVNAEAGVISDAELEQMLAPIALYPDSLLTHILIAATYPLEIIQAQRWLSGQTTRDTEQLMVSVEAQSWDPSVKALVAFPNVLQRLNDDLAWTQDLGDAFLQDEGRMLDSIQTLRQQADDADSLANIEQVKITKVERRIIIESVQPEIVYVPYYDSRIVYGNWRWNRYPPVYWQAPAYVHYRPNHGVIFWDTGVRISFNFFFSNFHWNDRRIIVAPVRHDNYYQRPRKITYSHGAQHWQHQPKHRKGVAYHNKSISQRYQGHYEKRRQPVTISRGHAQRSKPVAVSHGSQHQSRVNEPKRHINNTPAKRKERQNDARQGQNRELSQHKSQQIKHRLSQQRQTTTKAVNRTESNRAASSHQSATRSAKYAAKPAVETARKSTIRQHKPQRRTRDTTAQPASRSNTMAKQQTTDTRKQQYRTATRSNNQQLSATTKRNNQQHSAATKRNNQQSRSIKQTRDPSPSRNHRQTRNSKPPRQRQ